MNGRMSLLYLERTRCSVHNKNFNKDFTNNEETYSDFKMRGKESIYFNS